MTIGRSGEICGKEVIMAASKASAAVTAIPKKRSLLQEIWKYRVVYLFMLPCVVSLLVFSYFPMYGATLAFKDYKYNLGILGSPWVGLKHFRVFFTSYQFWLTLRNSVVISLLKTLFCFPAPIILALLLNELRFPKFKRWIQTFTYLPHFVSWAVIVTIMTAMFSPNGGVINRMREYFDLPSLFFMGERRFFYPTVVLSSIWEGVGWGSIIYLSALSGINPELYESAFMDGAGKLRCVWHITLPGIKATVGILFIFEMGSLLNAGFGQILLLQQPANLEISEILDTYVLRVGLAQGRFELGSAIGLFRSVFGFCLIMITNWVSKKFLDVGLF
jgi:putative aldouronate transport system permease protein